MKKCLIIIAMCFVMVAANAQHEGIERHFDEYVFGDFSTISNYYSADTLIDRFHIYSPQYPFVMSTGNMALPATPAFYRDRLPTHEFIFFQPYAALCKNFDHLEFFDARRPFTRIHFIGGAKQLDDISFVHTQNIKPWLNVGAEYHSMNSMGHYSSQQLRGHSAHLFADYRRNRYSGHLAFIHNKISHQNNGGIESDSDFALNVQRPENLSVNLYNSTTRLGQTGVMYNHEFKFGPKLVDTVIKEKDTLVLKTYPSRFRLGQELSYNHYYRVYEDVPSAFYQNIYLDSVSTFDSLSLRKFRHVFSLLYVTRGAEKKIPDAAMSLGLVSDVAWYHSRSAVLDQILQYRWFSQYAAYQWNAAASYCFMGQRAGDVHLNALIRYFAGSEKQHEFSAVIKARNERPDVFLLGTVFNNFKWAVTDIPYRDASLNLGYNNKKWGSEINLQYSFLDNYLYFNHEALPAVNENNCQVLSASVAQLLHVGIFYWRNQLQTQYFSDNTAYDLPALGVSSSLYLKTRIFKQKLGFQTGFDASWMSQSKGFAYMPATGTFYQNVGSEYGNFVILDFHAAISVKRFRAFAKLSHFNQAFMKANYFSLLHYPINPMSFNFGISWEFYD